MSTITTRTVKGSPLTWAEADANFTNLNTDKWEDSIIHAATSKTTPVDNDEFVILDSAASYVKKKTLWSSVKATLKSYTDTLYSLVGAVTSSGLTMSTGKLLGRTTAATGAVEEITVGSGLTLSSGTLTASAGATEQSLTNYYLPSLGSAYQDKYRSGELPYCFNQQWGGAQWGMLPDGSFGSVATGNVQDDGFSQISQIAGNYYKSEGFKISESATYDAVWVKLYKSGNPTYNLTARIYSDTAGSPNAALGSAATVSAKVLTSKTDGEWVQITGLAAALTAGTQYHLVLSSLAAVDATNFVNWKGTAVNKYPHGYANAGTSVPAWTPTTTTAFCFLIQNPAANSIIQSGGMFDYKLAFNPGTPWNQSRMTGAVLANYWDGKTCTYLHRGTYAVSTNVVDYCYGIDHDRFTLTINGSGFPVLTIYRSDRTAYTVTGTGSVTSGNHDVGFRLRTAGDGADYATLYVDGVSVGTPLTAQTFSMDVNFNLLGTRITGGGFGLAPTWTQDMQMTSLPSAQGWTWTGVATEANAMSVSGGKLYQNATGYTALQDGYYLKTTVFVNGTGWATTWRVRASTDVNAVSVNPAAAPVNFVVQDGTKYVGVCIHEYFIQVGGSTFDFTIQGDFRSQDHVYTLQGKGSDYYLFIDGKLAVDGTGKLTSASGLNNIQFGDKSVASTENSDAIWSYVKYYQGGMILPTANTGTCSEFAHWSGDKSALFSSLYNSGSPVSVKQLCGVPRNYQFEQVVQREVRRGVTSGPTTTSTSDVLLTDMECYVIGSDLVSDSTLSAFNNTAGQNVYLNIYADGVFQNESFNYGQSAIGGAGISIPSRAAGKVPLGLHKLENRWQVNANTATAAQTKRSIKVEARS